MKICPKCRSFYDGRALGFCPNDGIILVEVSKTDDYWKIGEKYLRDSKAILKRRKIIGSIKKVFVYFVTTTIFAALVAVIIVNTVIYITSTKEVPVKNESIIETLEIATKDGSETFVSPTAMPRVTPTPTEEPQPTAMPPVTPKACDKNFEKERLITENLHIWTRTLEKERLKIEKEYALIAKQYGSLDIKKAFKQEVRIKPECLTAEVYVHYEIYAEIQGIKTAIKRNDVKFPKAGYWKFTCKKDDKWFCDSDLVS